MVSDTIQFIYNNKIFKIKNPDPNQTILDFIRSDLKKLEQRKGVQKADVEHVLLFLVS